MSIPNQSQSTAIADNHQPVYIFPDVRCNHCNQSLHVTGINFSHPKRFDVHHLDSGGQSGCVNAGKRWVVELVQPKVYPVDLVTGEIDTFGGMV